MLGIEREREDVPRVESLVVRGGEVEGSYLVFWVP